MELFLIKKVDLSEIKENITKVLPEGLAIEDIKRVPLLFASLDSLVNHTEFKIRGIDISQKTLDAFLSQEKIIIIKEKKGKTSEIDIKPIIRKMQIDGKTLTLLLCLKRGAFIKPEIILRKLFEKSEPPRHYLTERSALYIETSDGKFYIP
jgi:uncharacterized protein (DUF2344 family)